MSEFEPVEIIMQIANLMPIRPAKKSLQSLLLSKSCLGLEGGIAENRPSPDTKCCSNGAAIRPPGLAGHRVSRAGIQIAPGDAGLV